MYHRKRLRLRDWLVQKINEGKYGLRGEGDPKDRSFRVPWKHGIRRDWSLHDVALFQAWQIQGRTGYSRPSKVGDEFQVCVEYLS